MLAQEMNGRSLSPGSYIRDGFAKGGERLKHSEQAGHEDSLGCSRLAGVYELRATTTRQGLVCHCQPVLNSF